jgi:hypothetical protein
MPSTKQSAQKPAQRKKSQRDEPREQGEAPARREVEAELPSSPAKDPMAEPSPVDRARSPRPPVEAEPE